MKKIFSLLLAAIISVSSVLYTRFPSYAASRPSLVAKYAVLLDYETGKVLYQKNGNVKMYPASTTKAWTAYLVIKHVKNLDETVTIGDLPYIEPTSMFLQKGESFTVRELLLALMLHSCNDVAYVLAEYVSGSIEEFAKLMNEEAEAIGCTNTHFNNPNGLPDTNHYSTAKDMALIARQAMTDSTFREIVSTESVTFEPTAQYPQKRVYTNSNQFLTSNGYMTYRGKKVPIKYDIVDGIKTGFTNAAGKCLLSTAIKDKQRVIAAVFNSTNEGIYPDSRAIIDYGFENYDSYTIVDKDEFVESKRKLFTKQKELVYQPEQNYTVLVSEGAPLDGEYTAEKELDNIDLPVKKGDVVGKMSVYKDGKLIKKINLVANNDLDSIFSFFTESSLFKILSAILKTVIAIIAILIILLILRKFYIRKKRRNRRKSSERESRKIHGKSQTPISKEKRKKTKKSIKRDTGKVVVKRKSKNNKTD
ncbi:D-alanyl-D-alanine carboxypeptidase [Peptacetobacter hominis]|uniref:serine-type D-Ala-D-Ala carboxypeptidase n=1 Tax=Peptacetobacter hominis TaxID=2743610 RepID=A0A544QYG3_9FIRM|nr:D-alanyl-D-alanine carboxypeptidase family protein [Peptacetobacter hominis]TQQ85690.1 D-alanyl-D-alanine carboxypeptidase [Peptacetobacter hominis]